MRETALQDKEPERLHFSTQETPRQGQRLDMVWHPLSGRVPSLLNGHRQKPIGCYPLTVISVSRRCSSVA